MVDARLCKKVRLDVFVASPIHFFARCLDAETNVSYKSKQVDELET